MSALTDIWHTIHNIGTTSDAITWIVILIIALGVAFMTEGLAMIVTSTFIALVAFGISWLTKGEFWLKDGPLSHSPLVHG